MSKELEALQEICGYYYQSTQYKMVETALKDYERRLKLAKEYEDVNNVGKRLKALEIIKEKKVDIYHIQATNKVGEYNFWRLSTSKRLKKKEYDLLKEVLL